MFAYKYTYTLLYRFSVDVKHHAYLRVHPLLAVQILWIPVPGSRWGRPCRRPDCRSSRAGTQSCCWRLRRSTAVCGRRTPVSHSKKTCPPPVIPSRCHSTARCESRTSEVSQKRKIRKMYSPKGRDTDYTRFLVIILTDKSFGFFPRQ